MTGDFIAVLVGDLFLQGFDLFVVKFDHLAGFNTHHVIVVVTAIQLKHTVAAIEVLPDHQTGIFKLGEHSIDCRQPDILTRIEQGFVDILGAQMALVGIFQNLQDLNPRQSHLEASFTKFLIFNGHQCFLRGLNSMKQDRYYPHPASIRKPLTMNYLFKRSCLFLSLLALCACSSLKFPGVYRIPIQQGNYLEKDMIDQLKVGLSKRQVRYIMGSPMLEDTFNEDRWDYYYSVRRGDTELRANHFVVFFENDKLTRWEGNYTPIKKQVEEEQVEALENTEKKKAASFD